MPIVWNTNETLEVRITTKKRTITGNLIATHTTYYWAHVKIYGDGLDFVTGDKRLVGYNSPLDDPSVKVEIRKTTANGAGNLECRVVWAQKEAV